jgi:hypothetical protein
MRKYALEIRHSKRFPKFPGNLDLSERHEWREAENVRQVIRSEIKRSKILPTTIKVLLRRGWIKLEHETEWGMLIYWLTPVGEKAIEGLNAEAFISTSQTNTSISTDFIIDALKVRHPRDRGWLSFTEVTMQGTPKARRIDVLFFNFWHSRKYQRIAYEIKRARSNFLQELREPDKRAVIMKYVNEFYFVTPKGMVKVSEIPENCGLVEVDDNGICRMKKRAPYLGDPAPNWYLVGTLLRSFYDKTEQIT